MDREEEWMRGVKGVRRPRFQEYIRDKKDKTCKVSENERRTR